MLCETCFVVILNAGNAIFILLFLSCVFWSNHGPTTEIWTILNEDGAKLVQRFYVCVCLCQNCMYGALLQGNRPR